MSVRIVEESVLSLPEYGKVSIAFEVISRFRVEGSRLGIQLIEEPVEPPYWKDYDTEEGERPTRWAGRWDIRHWGFLAAFDGEVRVGGAVIAFRTPGVTMLDGREDRAALWDLRINPAYRARGIGRALFNHAIKWCRSKGCRDVKVETQNINVNACRFYERQGCVLAAVNPWAYPEHPEEIQLIWYSSL